VTRAPMSAPVPPAEVPPNPHVRVWQALCAGAAARHWRLANAWRCRALLIGAVGTGKTTVLRHLVARLQPAVRCILAEYPPSNCDELLTFASRELGVQRSDQGGRLDRVSALNRRSLTAALRT
jgi:hypothetical protein